MDIYTRHEAAHEYNHEQAGAGSHNGFQIFLRSASFLTFTKSLRSAGSFICCILHKDSLLAFVINKLSFYILEADTSSSGNQKKRLASHLRK